MATVARASFRVVRGTPLRRIAERDWFERFRTHIYAMAVDDVLEALDALAGADVPAWLAGGWGIDALLGAQTRTHGDVDVVISDAAGARGRAVAALSTLGYVEVEDGGDAGHWLPVRSVLRDRSGRTIDLLSGRTSPTERAHERSGHVFRPEDLTTGQLSGRTVPCISAALQVHLHTGYTPTDHDVRDVVALCNRFGLTIPREYAASAGSRRSRWRRIPSIVASLRVRRLPASTVVVPVAAASDAVALGGPPGSVPAHITLLYPFVPAAKLADRDIDALRELAATTEPFPIAVTRTGRFPGVLYLAPDAPTAARLVALTEALVARWPSYPPYGGRFASIVPHLTIYEGDAEPVSLEARVRAHLPIETTAEELLLLVQDTDRQWFVRDRFPLG